MGNFEIRPEGGGELITSTILFSRFSTNDFFSIEKNVYTYAKESNYFSLNFIRRKKSRIESYVFFSREKSRTKKVTSYEKGRWWKTGKMKSSYRKTLLRRGLILLYFQIHVYSYTENDGKVLNRQRGLEIFFKSNERGLQKKIEGWRRGSRIFPKFMIVRGTGFALVPSRM